MSIKQNAVLEAIERWAGASVIDADTADRLREAEAAHAVEASTRLSQYVLAVSGAAVLMIAGGVFLEWAWPTLDEVGRTVTLALTGIAVSIGGIALEQRGRWTPSSYALQTAGVGLLLAAFVWSERAWPDQSLPATLFGVSALVVPIALGWRALHARDRWMPAVHFAAGLGFLAVFLDRATPLSSDVIIWTLDLVLLASIVGLGRLLRSDTGQARHPWALNTFIGAMGAGFILVVYTAAGPLGMGDEIFLALDLWWALTLGLTVFGLERGGALTVRGGLQYLLAAEVLAWIGLGIATARETFDQGPGSATLLVSSVAVVAFVYADRRSHAEVLLAAAIAFVVPIWIWAVEAAGALGGIAALVLTAGLLFWAAGRRGSAGAG